MAQKKQDAARVRYIGNATRRIVNEYEWNADNGYVQTVRDAALVERLVANGDFVVVDGEPEATDEASKEQAL